MVPDLAGVTIECALGHGFVLACVYVLREGSVLVYNVERRALSMREEADQVRVVDAE